MTRDQVTALLGHDRMTATYLVEEVLSGHHLPAPAGTGPAVRFAADTALLESRGLAVTGYADASLHGFVNRLDHRIATETAALAGDAAAMHRLGLGG